MLKIESLLGLLFRSSVRAETSVCTDTNITDNNFQIFKYIGEIVMSCGHNL